MDYKEEGKSDFLMFPALKMRGYCSVYVNQSRDESMLLTSLGEFFTATNNTTCAPTLPMAG